MWLSGLKWWSCGSVPARHFSLGNGSALLHFYRVGQRVASEPNKDHSVLGKTGRVWPEPGVVRSTACCEPPLWLAKLMKPQPWVIKHHLLVRNPRSPCPSLSSRPRLPHDQQIVGHLAPDFLLCQSGKLSITPT